MTVKRPGMHKGSNTRKIICNSEVPSSMATSLSELGILIKALRIMNTPSGNIKVECKKIKPYKLLSKPISFKILYKGISKDTPGKRMGVIMSKKIMILKGPRKIAKA